MARTSVFSLLSFILQGVLILIHKSIPLQIMNTIEDRLERCIIIQAEILSIRPNLVNV